jgi:hypothetical protein
VASILETRKALEHDCQRSKSPLRRTAEAVSGIDIPGLERIEPFCVLSWQSRARVKIYDGDKAIELTSNADLERAIFTDASNRNGLVGVGIAHLSG